MIISFIDTIETWGGGEQWFLWAAKAMSKQGHEAFIVTTPRSKLALQSLNHGLTVEYMQTKIPFFLQLRRIFHNRMPRVAVCNTGRESRAAIVARGFSREPAIVFRRGLCKGLGKPLISKWFYSRVDKFICNSQATANAVKQSQPWLTDSKLSVMYNPIPIQGQPDPEKVEWWRKELDVFPDDFVIISVGRLDHDKGHIYLLEAFEKVLRDYPTARLFIAGEGREQLRLEAKAADLGIAKRVGFCGFIHNMTPLYQLAHLMVQPSLPGYESFSNAALEALNCGLPIVATTVGGYPELIINGKEGLLVSPYDSKQLAVAIMKLIENEAFRTKLGSKGREKARENYNQAKKIKELENCLKEVVHTR